RRYQDLLLRYEQLVRAGDELGVSSVSNDLARLGREIGSGQSSEWRSLQNSLPMHAALGVNSPGVQARLPELFGQLWSARESERKQKWAEAQEKESERSQRTLLRVGLAGRAFETAVEKPGCEQLARASSFLHLL